MDHHKLRSAVFEKTGIKIDTTDPVFALVALNEAVLEEMFQRHLNLLQASHGAAAPNSGQHRAPVMPDNWEQEEVASEADPRPASPEPDAPAVDASNTHHQATPHPAHPAPPVATGAAAPLDKRLLAFGAATGLAAALLVVLVQSLFNPGLSQEQKQQLQKAEKLRQAIDQLDPKLKAQLPPEIIKR